MLHKTVFCCLQYGQIVLIQHLSNSFWSISFYLESRCNKKNYILKQPMLYRFLNYTSKGKTFYIKKIWFLTLNCSLNKIILHDCQMIYHFLLIQININISFYSSKQGLFIVSKVWNDFYEVIFSLFYKFSIFNDEISFWSCKIFKIKRWRCKQFVTSTEIIFTCCNSLKILRFPTIQSLLWLSHCR